MDAMVVDPEAHLLYVADGTSPDHPGVDVVDIGASSAAYRATIATGDAPPNGLALVPERHRLYAGGDDGSVSIIDLTPGSPRFQTVVATLTTAHTGPADLLTYDPVHRMIYTPDGIVHEAGLYAFPDPVRN